MKIFFTDQSTRFEQLLAELKSSPSMKFDKKRLPGKRSFVEIATNAKPGDLNLGFLFDYKIFPPAIMTSLPQWQMEGRNMKIGDVILQQVFVPPTGVLSQKIVFGVRINQIIKEVSRVGFGYETIEGHVEKGESTFIVEESESGILFEIQTWSEPGNLITRLLGPVCTIPYQAYCTRAALRNVRRQIEAEIGNAGFDAISKS